MHGLQWQGFPQRPHTGGAPRCGDRDTVISRHFPPSLERTGSWLGAVKLSRLSERGDAVLGAATCQSSREGREAPRHGLPSHLPNEEPPTPTPPVATAQLSTLPTSTDEGQKPSRVSDGTEGQSESEFKLIDRLSGERRRGLVAGIPLPSWDWLRL